MRKGYFQVCFQVVNEFHTFSDRSNELSNYKKITSRIFTDTEALGSGGGGGLELTGNVEASS